MTAPTAVAIATGESRPVVKTWPDGSFTCPWCGAGNPPTVSGCGNPACWAYPTADADHVRAEQARRAEREAERQRAAERAEAAQAALAASRERDAQLWRERNAEAVQRGACMTCLRGSDWRHRPKFVRHRRADFHEIDAKETA